MDPLLRSIRERDFARLDASGQVYLDHTGSALYPEALVRSHAERLCSAVLGNPHSRSPSSRASTEACKAARARVLEFFNGDPAEYEVIFTANATGGLKLVGEGFPFEPGGRLRMTADNHNSVNGIREFAVRGGADVAYVPIGSDLRVADLESELAGADPERNNLFAYPAQSNFSGVQHPLEWIDLARGLGYRVLLDAAAYVPTSRLDLARVKPDFTVVSFYKMFGYPTGVGALIARRGALALLRRPWFGGGTVRFASAQNRVHIMYRDAAAFEDGTLNFLDISAVPAGLDYLDSIGMDRIHAHVVALTGVLLERLTSLRHSNGAPMVRIYGPQTTSGRGGTVAFNLLTVDGKVVDCRLVEAAAIEAGISIRTGYFCNPGAAEASFELPEDEARRCFEELAGDDFTLQQFSVCLHDKPVGAVRVSVGFSSNETDIDRLIALLEGFRDRVAPRGEPGAGQVAVGTAASA
ncbi:MAG TPA: aminotransferase class V-fold PLP-dependent enzyme [Longimicrobiales bacterium]|nr:aminotransferase class V-fold PLP-dependent enzyme [Longimicrobiales bacterium]